MQVQGRAWQGRAGQGRAGQGRAHPLGSTADPLQQSSWECRANETQAPPLAHPTLSPVLPAAPGIYKLLGSTTSPAPSPEFPTEAFLFFQGRGGTVALRNFYPASTRGVGSAQVRGAEK